MIRDIDVADDALWCVELHPAPADVGIAEEVLAALGCTSSSWVNLETREAVVRVFTDNRKDAEALAARLNAGLPSWSGAFQGALPPAASTPLRREDWTECWKEHFHTFRASRRIVVKPSWESYEAAAGDLVVELDPGMCFGTGYHGTTRACLTFLDDLADALGPVSLLDVGCGSGILSLAAATLGYRPVEAFDIDPDAVRIARENLDKAGVVGVDIRVADMAAFEPLRHYRVVAANVLAHVLRRHLRRLLDWIDTSEGPGYLLLAGMLADQYDDLRRQLKKAGAHEVEVLAVGEWTSGCFRVRRST